MAGPSISPHTSEAARALIRDTDQLALAVTERLFRESPELLEKYGQRGYDKCLQDMRYNVEHLVPAVEMQDAGMFTRYVEWLDGLLRARNVPTTETLRCLELLRNEVFVRYDRGEVDAINAILDAGIAVVQPR
jgi:hypothetical protein